MQQKTIPVENYANIESALSSNYDRMTIFNSILKV